MSGNRFVWKSSNRPGTLSVFVAGRFPSYREKRLLRIWNRFVSESAGCQDWDFGIKAVRWLSWSYCTDLVFSIQILENHAVGFHTCVGSKPHQFLKICWNTFLEMKQQCCGFEAGNEDVKNKLIFENKPVAEWKTELLQLLPILSNSFKGKKKIWQWKVDSLLKTNQS